MSRILDLWLSGETRRWHCNPAVSRVGQNNADHQGRCAQLAWALWPDASPALIWACLHHDVGEYEVGDLSADFKRCADPTVIEGHAEIEAQALTRICGRPMPELSVTDAQRLKLVDRLEALMTVCFHVPWEALRVGSGWDRQERRLIDDALALGVGGEVDRMLQDLREGRW